MGGLGTAHHEVAFEDAGMAPAIDQLPQTHARFEHVRNQPVLTGGIPTLAQRANAAFRSMKSTDSADQRPVGVVAATATRDLCRFNLRYVDC